MPLGPRWAAWGSWGQQYRYATMGWALKDSSQSGPTSLHKAPCDRWGNTPAGSQTGPWAGQGPGEVPKPGCRLLGPTRNGVHFVSAGHLWDTEGAMQRPIGIKLRSFPKDFPGVGGRKNVGGFLRGFFRWAEKRRWIFWWICRWICPWIFSGGGKT